MKKNRASKLWKIALAFAISISSVAAFVSATNLIANDSFDVNEIVEVNEDKTQATITLDVTNINEQYSIESIQNPDDSIMDMINHPSFVVDKNGTYIFKVIYYDTSKVSDGEEAEALTYEKQVEVSELGEEDEDPDDEIKSQEGMATPDRDDQNQITPFAGETVTINIPTYNSATGWKNGEVKDVEVSVDFKGDETSAGKIVEFTLPDGMRFVQIPIVEGKYNTAGVDTDLVAPFESSDSLAKVITAITLPQKEAITNSTFGKVSYQFKENTAGAQLTFKVRIDSKKYHGPHILVDKMIADAYMKGIKVSSTNTEISAVGGTVGVDPFGFVYANSGATLEARASTSAETEYGFTNKYYLPIYSSDDTFDEKYRYIKNATYYLYYPQGMEYESVEGAPDSATVTNDPLNSRVIVKVPQYHSYILYRVKYKIPEGTSPNTYTDPQFSEVEFEAYNGTKITATASAKYSVKIVDNFLNKIDIRNVWNGEIDASIDNHYRYGPFFYVENKTAGVKRNQIYHVEIDSLWQTKEVTLPFDDTVDNNKISKVEYKTNLNASWRSLTNTQINALRANGNTTTNFVKVLNGDEIGLATNEYFTEVRAAVGAFNVGYLSGITTRPRQNTSVTTYGKLVPYATSATVNVSMYDENDKDATLSTSSGVITNVASQTKTAVSQSTANFRAIDGEKGIITQLNAGKSFNVSGVFRGHNYNYGSTGAIIAPEIYLRQPEGMSLSIDSLQLKDQDGNNLTGYTITNYKNEKNEVIYKIQTSSTTAVGYFFGAEQKEKRISYSFNMHTNIKTKGNYNARDIIGIGKSYIEAVVNVGAANAPAKDVHDLNGNKNTTELMLTTLSKELTINENKSVLVETFLSLKDQPPKDPYVEGDDRTLAYFTPEIEADYTLKLTNNSPSPATKYVMYIPIPKTGENFGSKFQDDPFKWDMKLRSTITNPDVSKFKISYATDATKDNYDQSGAGGPNYTESSSVNLANVNMVRIEGIGGLAIDAQATFLIPLTIDETFEGAGDKIGTKNIYNPSNEIISATFSGTIAGTKVGTELIIAEIGGIVFEDKNGDGLYKASNDALLKDVEVFLWKYNESSKVYDKVMDGSNQVSTKTDANGVYLFNYKQNLGYEKYAVSFASKPGYQFTFNNNSVGNEAINSDVLLDGPYKGWILDIDAKKPDAKTLGCGYLDYDASDLTLSLPSEKTIRVGESINVGALTIAPTFWENIKHPTDAYKWELVVPADSQYVTLANTTSALVSLTGVKKTSTPINLKLTIKDVFGYTTAKTMKVNVVTNVGPTFTLSDVNAYVGDSLPNWTNGITAVDDDNNPITLVTTGVNKNTDINVSSIPDVAGKYGTPGTYNVVYKISDKYGNTTTKNRKVKVNGIPVITSTPQEYMEGEVGLDAKVKGSATATYKKASETVGNAPIDTAVTPITYAIENNIPSNNFSKPGLYVVIYSTQIDGRSAIDVKENVIVKPKDGINENNLSLDAHGFSIKQVDASTLNETKVLNLSNALALETIKSGNTITNVKDVTNQIVVNGLSAIQSTDSKGGIYTVTLTIKHSVSGLSVSKDIMVVVEGSDVVVQNGIVLTAKDASITNVEAKTIDEKKAKIAASAKAYTIKTGVEVSVDVDAMQLNTIENVGIEGGNFPLTFKVGSAPSKQVQFTVEKSKVGPTVVAPTLEVFVNDAIDYRKNITATSSNGSQVTITTTNTKIVGNVDNTIANTGKVQIIVNDGYGETSVDRIIKVHGAIEVFANHQVYVQGSSNIANDVKNAASAKYKEASDTVGANPVEKAIIPTNEILDGPSNDYSKAGLYTVKYTATKALKSNDKTVIVLVKPKDAIEGHNLVLDANSFTISQGEKATFNSNGAKTKAQASAYEISELLGVITKIEDRLPHTTITGVDAVRNAPSTGGIYPLTFTLESQYDTSKSITKTIYVVVEGDDVEINDEYAIWAKDYTIANALAASHSETNAKTLSEVKAIHIPTSEEVALNTIAVNTTQLTAIQAVDANGDTLPLTFSTNGVSKTVQVKVSASISGPTINANDLHLFINGSYNELDGISASEVDGSTITLVLNGNTKVSGVVNIATIGIYTTTIEVKDKHGVTNTTTRDIHVNGLPTINASNQEYKISETNILQKVKDHATASYINSQNTSVNILDVNIDSISGPNDNFTKVGMYEVTYKTTLTINGVTKTENKMVKVAINKDDAVKENNVVINANNFTVANEDAKNFSEDDVIDAAKVFAYNQPSLSIINNIRVTSGLNAINNAPSTGGIYEVVIKAIGDSGDASIKVYAVVLGENIETNADLAIYANGFVVENADAINLNLAKVKEHSNVKAINLITNEDITNISVNNTQLTEIINAPKAGGFYNLTLSATDAKNNQVSKTILVVVKGVNVEVNDGLSIYANGFVLENTQRNISEAQAIAYANAKAYVIANGKEITNIKVNEDELKAITLAPITGGIYNLTFSASIDGKSVSKIVTVVVKGTNTEVEPGIEDSLVLQASGFILENHEAINLSANDLLTKSDAKAMLINAKTPVIVSLKSTAQLNAIRDVNEKGGVYDVTLKAEKDDMYVELTIKVIVKGTGTEVEPGIEDTLVLQANGFTLENYEASGLSVNAALTKSQASAYLINAKTPVNVTLKDNAQLTNIKKASLKGGVYDLTLRAQEDDMTVDLTIKVVVKGTNTEVEPGTEDSLVLQGDGFTIENSEAASLSANDILEKSDAKAFLLEAQTPVSVSLKNSAQLTAIKNVGKKGGIYDVTLKATKDDMNVELTIKVAVKGTNTEVGPGDEDTIVLQANSFVIENSEASSINTNTILTKSQAKAVLLNAKTPVEVTLKNSAQLSAIRNTTTKGGVYDITLAADEEDMHAQLTIQVVVKGTNIEVEPGLEDTLILQANGFTLENNEATSLSVNELLTKSEAKAFLLDVKTEVDVTLKSNTQLSAIQNAGKQGGIFDVTLQATKDDMHVELTIKVVVKGTNTEVGPGLEDTLVIHAQGFAIENSEASSLNANTILSKSKAQALLLNAKTSVDVTLKNNAQLTAIRNASIKGGIYDVTLIASEDDMEAQVTIKVVVKGSNTEVEPGEKDLLVLQANGFTIENSEAFGLSVDEVLTKSQAKAQLVNAKTPVDVTLKDASQLTAIQKASGKGGIYDVTLSATKDDMVVELTIHVVVKGSGIEVEPGLEDTLVIRANGFIVENNEAASLSANDVIIKSQAKALLLNAKTPVNVTLKTTSQLTAIKNATSKGGIYDVTLTATKDDMNVELTIKVVVKGTGITIEPQENDTLALNANSFVLNLMQSALITKDSAIEHANAQAYLVETNATVNVDVDLQQLNTIRSTTITGGIYDLTFNATQEDMNASKSVKVVVTGLTTPEPKPTPDGDKLAITAQNFSINYADIASLSKAQVVSKASAQAWLIEAKMPISVNIKDADFNTLKAINSEGGIVDVTFSATSQGVTIETTIKVTIIGSNTPDPKPTPENDKLAISAKGFVLENTDAKNLNATSAISKAQAKAYLLESKEEVTVTIPNQAQLDSIKNTNSEGGIYNLTFSATAQSTTNTSTVLVVVKGSNVVENEGIAIHAKGFALTQANKNINANDAISKAQVRASLVVSGKEVTNISVDPTQLLAIQNAQATGGIYDLTFTASENGKVVSITIKVAVEGSDVIIKDGIVLQAKGFKLSGDEAKALDAAQAIHKAQAKAFKIVSGESVSVEVNATELKAIVDTTKGGAIYDLTFNALTVSKEVDVEVEISEIKIVDDFGVNDGIIVIYRTGDTGEPKNYAYTHNLKIESGGVELTSDQLKDVTWSVEVDDWFVSTHTYVTIKNGTNVVEAKKSGIVKLSASYKGKTSSIDIVIPGDISGDGAINSMDATRVQRYNSRGTFGTVGFDSKYNIFIGDMNGDGATNSMDATLLQRMNFGTIKPSN